jgi:murein DD-endopeptidase MepM/ murein hydrolase activator NlpD
MEDHQQPQSPEGAPGRDKRSRRRSRRLDLASTALAAGLLLLAGGAAVYLSTHARSFTQPVTATEHPARMGSMARSHTHSGSSPTASAIPPTSHAQSMPAPGVAVRPVDGPVVLGYGWQYQKSLGLYRDMPGWDLASPVGTPVRAVLGGQVVANWMDPTEGREVVIRSRNGDSIIYGDLESPGPKVGTVVQAGQVFAKVGSPGRLSGVSEPHLFLEITRGGQPVDPSTLLASVSGMAGATGTKAQP